MKQDENKIKWDQLLRNNFKRKFSCERIIIELSASL